MRACEEHVAANQQLETPQPGQYRFYLFEPAAFCLKAGFEAFFDAQIEQLGISQTDRARLFVKHDISKSHAFRSALLHDSEVVALQKDVVGGRREVPVFRGLFQ